MDKLKEYRTIIQNLLTQYFKIASSQINASSKFNEVSDRLAIDETRDEYIWLRFGWDGKKQVQHIIIYLSIKKEKIWVEEDKTNLCIVDDLLSAGVPKQDIVLGFHPPSKRPLTELLSTNGETFEETPLPNKK